MHFGHEGGVRLKIDKKGARGYSWDMANTTNPLPPLTDFAPAGRTALASLPQAEINRITEAAGGDLSDEVLAAIGILLDSTNYIDCGRGLVNETHPTMFIEEYEYFGCSISGYNDLAQVLGNHLNRILAAPLRDRFRFGIECEDDGDGASMYSVAHRVEGDFCLATFEDINYIHPSGTSGEYAGLLGAASALATIAGDYYRLVRSTLH